jgi:DNA-binding LytR/AlgR family response regulator
MRSPACGTAAPSSEPQGDVDLLFTAVVMPGGMNGRGLADAARRVRPGLRVLFTSGYTENAVLHHGRLEHGALLLTKPYRRAQLDRAIRGALDSPAPAVAEAPHTPSEAWS